MKHKVLISLFFLLLFTLQQDQSIAVCENVTEITEVVSEPINPECDTNKIKNFLTSLDTLDRIVLVSYLVFAGTIIYLLSAGK